MLARYLSLTLLALGSWALPARAADLARYTTQEAHETVRTVSVTPAGSYIQIAGDLTIQSVFLADLSRVVYGTNVPVESSQARVVYLKRIETQNFPGAIPATVPNLLVTAADPQGNLTVFTVALSLETGHPERLIIGGDAALQSPEVAMQHLRTQFGPANIHDLEAGLNEAIARGSLEATGPTAVQLREFIALWRNGSSVAEAQASSGLRWGILSRLAADGQVRRNRDRRARFRETPPSTPAAGVVLPPLLPASTP